MSQTRFNLPSLYNPATQTNEEIITNFIVRLEEFDEIFQAIKKDKMNKPPQHYLVLGQRGYGKTTLLLRLKIEIKKNRNLSVWLVPVMFDEEQYSVRTLAKFWEEIIEVLESEDEAFEGLSEKVDALYDTANPEEEIFNLLTKSLKKQNKKIVLLLDNFGDMIQKFRKNENHQLREVLMTSNHIRFIGASSSILEFHYDYKQPFFDFFKTITLNQLNREDTIRLLKKLGQTYKSKEINQIINKQPERIDSLRQLTGGVPRTVVLLFRIFVDNVNGDSFRDLEIRLDNVTPLYKDRLDNLKSPVQQAIIDAVAQNWDAISTKEITQKVRISSKEVSAQLNQLEKAQLITKIQTSTKNQLYQLSERFFNIYYLMRLGRKKNKNKVLWLVKFFEIMCGGINLSDRVNKHIQGVRAGRFYPKHAYYLSQALSQTNISPELQHKLISETKKYLAEKKSELVSELDKSYLEAFEEVKNDILSERFDRAEKKLKKDGTSEIDIPFKIAEVLRIENKDFKKAEEYYLMAVEKNHADAMNNLAVLYHIEFNDFKKAEKYYLMAVEKNHADAMNNLAVLYHIEFKDFKKAEKYYLMAVEKDHADDMNNLAALYQTEFKDFKKAEKYFLMAVEKDDSGAMYNLAFLYKTEFKDFKKAEKYFLMAVEKEHADAMNNLAALYHIEFKDVKKAEKYYLMAVEKNHAGAMNNLAMLYHTELKDVKKAEKYYLMTIEKDQSAAMNNLAWLYYELRIKKTKALYVQRQAFKIEKSEITAHILLILLLWNDEIEEACELYTTFLKNEETQKNVNELIYLSLKMFLAKKQYHFIHNLFNENKFDIKEKYKPVYYATLKLLGKKYSDVFKRMPPELSESVEKLLKEINQMSSDYK